MNELLDKLQMIIDKFGNIDVPRLQTPNVFTTMDMVNLRHYLQPLKDEIKLNYENKVRNLLDIIGGLDEKLKNMTRGFEASKFMIKVLGIDSKEEIYKKGIECQEDLNTCIDILNGGSVINNDGSKCGTINLKKDKYFDTENKDKNDVNNQN